MRPLLPFSLPWFISKRFRGLLNSHRAPRISKPIGNEKSWNRRCFEAALEPIYNEIQLSQSQKCQKPQETLLELQKSSTANPDEIALRNTIRLQLKDAKVLAICQRLPVDERHLHLDRMEIQSQGLQTRIVNPNIMRLVCENTSLSNLKPTLSGDLIILWANDIEDAHKISKFAKKIHWITLLACSMEGRLLTSHEFEWFVDNRANILQQHTNVTGALRLPVSNLMRNFTSHGVGLTSTLSYRVEDMKKRSVN